MMMMSNTLEKSMNTALVALPPSAYFHINSVKRVTADSVERLDQKPT